MGFWMRRVLFSPIPGRASNQTTEKQEVFCPFNSFVLGVTPLPAWAGLGRAGAILGGESQRPWGAPSTVRQTTRMEGVSGGHSSLGRAGGVRGAGPGRPGSTTGRLRRGDRNGPGREGDRNGPAAGGTGARRLEGGMGTPSVSIRLSYQKVFLKRGRGGAGAWTVPC